MRTSSGSQLTMFVVRRTAGSSARVTIAIAYGGSNDRSHWCRLTVLATTVARPETTVGADDRLPHAGHTGVGGCTKAPQSVQPWIRSLPSAPDVQNHSFHGVSCGRERAWGARGGPDSVTSRVPQRRRGQRTARP